MNIPYTKSTIQDSLLIKIAGGTIVILTTLVFANARAFSDNVSKLQDSDALQNVKIETVTLTARQSACVNNSNFRNLAIALKASWVPDPNCDIPR